MGSTKGKRVVSESHNNGCITYHRLMRYIDKVVLELWKRSLETDVERWKYRQVGTIHGTITECRSPVYTSKNKNEIYLTHEKGTYSTYINGSRIHTIPLKYAWNPFNRDMSFLRERIKLVKKLSLHRHNAKTEALITTTINELLK